MKFLTSSRILFWLVCLCFATWVQGQDVIFELDNPSQTFNGTDSIYEVDVNISSITAPGAFKMSSGQLYFNFNTAAFGTNLVTNAKISIDTVGSLLGLKDAGFGILYAYEYPNFADNTPERFSIAWQQNVADACINQDVNTTAQKLFRLKVTYLSGGSGNSADVCFETDALFRQQTYTGCGPFGACAGLVLEDCTGFPGTRITVDDFSCIQTVVNTAPSATPDTFTTNEDVAVATDVAANDSDAEDGTLSLCDVTITTQPTNGTLSIDPATPCTITYTPNANYNGTDGFSYEICDSEGLCSSASASITVQSINDLPVVVGDTETVLEDTPISILVADNDSDLEDGTLDNCSASILVQPANGSITIGAVPLCDVIYTPNAEYSGPDSFVYQVCDTDGGCGTAVVAITVTAVNDAPFIQNDNSTVSEDIAQVIDVLSNDSDPDGTLDACTVSVANQPANGAVTIGAAPGCALTYTPDPDYTGFDSFIYQACDDGGECGTAAVNITVNAVNDPPFVQADNPTVVEDTPTGIDVLANDNDVEGALDPCNVTITNQPTNGTLSIGTAPSCVLTYTPDADFAGIDSFIYQVCDSGGVCGTAAVNVTISAVNDAPFAQADNPSVIEDTPTAINVLGNDSDAEGPLDPCAVTITNQPANGTITTSAAPACEITYTPDANYAGLDSFIYEVCDGGGACSTAAVNISIAASNDAPVVQNDNGNATEDTPTTIDVLANDSDDDGALDPCAVVIATQPANGTASIGAAPACEVTYVPNADFSGADSFVYQVCDSGGACSTGSVSVAVAPVNDLPVANDDTASTNEDVPGTIDVLANDSDLEDNTLSPCDVTITNQPANGSVTIGAAPTCALTYTPNAGFSGADSFTYQICDSGGACAQASVAVDVIDITEPWGAVDDADFTTEDTPVVVDVVSNDSSADITLDPCDVTVQIAPANGTVSIGAAPACELTYTPNPDFNGIDTFTYEVCDTEGICDNASVNITVAPVNDLPVAQGESVSTAFETPGSIDVVANDSDVEDGTLNPCNVTVATGPSNGAISQGPAPGCALIYTPNAGYAGPDQFVYSVCDANGGCSTAQVDITVTADPNTAPVVTDDTGNTNQDTPAMLNVVGNDSDAEGTLDPCSVTISSAPANGNVVLGAAPACLLTYTPNAGYAGTDSFEYEICDAGGLCDQGVVTLTVILVNTPPTAQADNATTPYETPVVVDVLANDADAEDATLAPCNVSITSQATNGTAAVGAAPSCTVTYTPAAGFSGSDNFTYQICDADGACSSATVTVAVTAPALDAVDDSFSSPLDEVLSTNVLSNDIGIVGGETVSLIASPTEGTLNLMPNGGLMYTPNTGFAGQDSFAYQVCDNGTPQVCDNAVVVLNIGTEIPTLSEWGLILLALLMLSFCTRYIIKIQPRLAMASTGSVPEDVEITFNGKLFHQALISLLVLSVLVFIVVIAVYGFITPLDVIGTLLSAVVLAYWIQLLKN